MSASLAIAMALGLILAGIRLGVGLAPSILAASFALGLARGLGPLEWLGALPAALATGEAALLVVMVLVIVAFSSVYAASGQSADFLAAVRGRVRSRSLLLAFFPALIGLLPMPGGAVFSAPMVAQAARDLDLSPEDHTLVNYWFRHVWELAWPLYPGVILAASLAGMPVTRVMALMWPAPVAAMALGWAFVLRPALRRAPRLQETGSAPVRAALRHGLPLAVAIGGAVVGEGLCAWLVPGLAMEWGVVGAMVAASAVSLALSRAGWRATLAEAAKDNPLGLLAVVAAVFVFKEVLVRGQVVEAVAAELGGGAALVALAVVLPLVVGAVSGVTVAFVGATFPLVLGLAASSGVAVPAVLCLGLCSGFAGIMASPMHICYLVSCRYFHVDPVRILPRVALPSLCFVPLGLLGYALLA